MSVRIKYPRTPHFMWSRGVASDDQLLAYLRHWIDQPVVITAKMDGENTTIYGDGLHARSIDSRSHPSRSWVQQWSATWRHELPRGWRVCGENLYARHSIHYRHLTSYFYGISIWNDENLCLAWDDTTMYFTLLGITPVPELWRGVWSPRTERWLRDGALAAETHAGDPLEGYVVRLAGPIRYRDFSDSVAKYVRAHHVQTTDRWSRDQIVPNRLRQSDS